MWTVNPPRIFSSTACTICIWVTPGLVQKPWSVFLRWMTST